MRFLKIRKILNYSAGKKSFVPIVMVISMILGSSLICHGKVVCLKVHEKSEVNLWY